MKKYLIFQDENRQEFWEIKTNQASCEIRSGMLATEGETVTQGFATAEQCEAEANKLVDAH